MRRAAPPQAHPPQVELAPVVLCVTGARRGRLDTVYWLERWVRRFGRPRYLVVGDSDRWTPWLGVDGQARVWGKQKGLSVVEELCHAVMRSPYRFQERDERMADHCGPGDWCLGLPDDLSRGTFLTMRHARDRGARVFLCPRAYPLA